MALDKLKKAQFTMSNETKNKASDGEMRPIKRMVRDNARWYHVFRVLWFFHEQNKKRLASGSDLKIGKCDLRYRNTHADLGKIFIGWFTNRDTVISLIEKEPDITA